ncbi:MAG: DUF2083 domain-containing protein [Caulobacteraceae bacterium]|nr:DUF2083 domain-containing protein [Caulobacteraceae bacterium]
MASSERKLFLGMRLRRLRRELGLSQTRMAEDLGLSPSYLNHMERNQRPLTAQVLLRLAGAYDIDIRSLSNDDGAGGARDLAEILADPMFRDLQIPRHEMNEVAEGAPGIADALARLYNARAGGEREERSDDEAAPRRERLSAADWVRDQIQAQRNFFPELDDAGEALSVDLQGEAQGFAAAAARRLAERHGVQVRIAPAELMAGSLRRYDHHRRRLMMSESLRAPARAFGLAYQLAMMEHEAEIAAMAERASPPDPTSGRLFKVALANYLAAAILLPYGPVREACEASGYDIGFVARRHGTSFEQVCHRLTTLSRPAARGIPFFMVRADAAGNISKRFSSGAFPFSRFGGACPRWRIHDAFRAPGAVLIQIIETLDGDRYFTLARAVRRVSSAVEDHDWDLVVALGCEIKYAARLIYARGLDLAHPRVIEVGPACRICERPACAQRAAEPVNRVLVVEDFAKSVSSYPFA